MILPINYDKIAISNDNKIIRGVINNEYFFFDLEGKKITPPNNINQDSNNWHTLHSNSY